LNPAVETTVEVAKGASLVNHLRQNRIEYLIGALILHSLGLFNTATEQLSGVCF
jgi:hypothetical protein